MKSVRYIVLILSLAGSLPALSEDLAQKAQNAPEASATTWNDDFLPADQAFQLNVLRKASGFIQVSWRIAPGYYLYRDKISVRSTNPTESIPKLQLPAGTQKNDEYFGDTQVFYGSIVAHIPVASKSSSITLRVSYQGCAEAGLCYAPITKNVTIDLGP